MTNYKELWENLRNKIDQDKTKTNYGKKQLVEIMDQEEIKMLRENYDNN